MPRLTDDERVRHSLAAEATLLKNPDEIARKEASNSILQAQRIKDIALDALHGDRRFRLRASTFLNLNRCAIEGLNVYAGNWRPGKVEIQKSKHQPPDAYRVPELVEDLCDYINENWDEKSAIHLSAYSMWRTNWIHPFADGNGRTARAVSYLVLCIKEGFLLPGLTTIPEQIVDNRNPYYDALEDADERYAADQNCENVVEKLEGLLAGMLAKQLTDAFNRATGNY